MATRVHVAFDASDPTGLAAFWAEALRYVIPEPPAAIVDPDRVGPRISFQRVPEPKTAKDRMHFDLNASVGRDVSPEERRANMDAEVARLKALGASDARGSIDEYGSYRVRMNDPEGNEFCVG